MNVVYPYRKNQSRELEWSLKSVEKHLKPKVVAIIGDMPPFHCKATIVGVDYPEWSRYSPYHNVIAKLLAACDLFDEFVLMNDDFFIMKPVDVTKYYNKGNMLDHLNARKWDSYSRAIKNTRNLLHAKGYTDVNFELHIPMLIKSDLMRQAIEEIMPQLKSSHPILIRSYYGNRFDLVSEHRYDVKNPTDFKELDIISTNEVTFKGELGEYIKEILS